jgi:hypothetical protein
MGVILLWQCVYPSFKIEALTQITSVAQKFIPNLKRHLLPRIRSALALDGTIDDSIADNWQAITFKHDQLYRHNIMRVNYTSYDVRRSDDVLHSGTHQSNIMVLNSEFTLNPRPSACIHPFLYARIIGIYHANVIYLGEGNRDYQPHRLEFLWVRWYDHFKLGDWEKQQLDHLQFPSIYNDHSFGFIDPRDVLRGCHLIPLLKHGKVYGAGDRGVSACCRDVNDWKVYVVNR